MTDPQPPRKPSAPRPMVRTLALLLASLAAFVGGYTLLSILMPDPLVVSSDEGHADASTLAPRESGGVIGDVESVTLRSTDPDTGRVVAEVFIGTYRRVDEGTVRLESVQATILMPDSGGEEGGVVTLTSPLGTVRLEGTAEAEGRIDAASLGAANVARLEDVTVRWFPDAATAARGPSEALLTLNVDHLVFDSNRYSFYTTDTVIDGRTVLADDVPVVVRGRDYDFDGRGLLIRWDGRTRRPTLFRVAHGERLTIKTEQPFVPTGVVASSERPRHESRVMLASLSQQAVADALAAQESAPATPYIARLSGRIRVEQAGRNIVEADAAEALLLLDQADETPAPTPATEPVPEPSAPRQPQQPPTTRPEAPATEPSEPFSPVTVRWDGPLEIEAWNPEVETRFELSAEDVPKGERVWATGSPLVLRGEGSEVRALGLTYDRGADLLELWAKEGEQVSLVDAEGNTVVAPRLLAKPDAGEATAVGAGYAEVRVDPKDGEAASDVLRMNWAEQCLFTFVEEEGQQPSLRSFDASGAVSVRHPDADLSAQRLVGTLVHGEEPALEALVATGGVDCRINPQRQVVDATTQPLDDRFLCEKLTLTLPEGPDGPIRVLAEGEVETRQAGQAMDAGVVDATFVLPEEGEPELIDLEATHVVAVEEDGSRLMTPLLTLEPPAEGETSPLLVATGEPSLPAVVTAPAKGLEQLAAMRIEMARDEERIAVPVAGTMLARVDRQEENQEPAFVDITWTGRLDASPEGATLRQDVSLHTVVREISEPGTVGVLDLDADNVDLDFSEDPDGNLAVQATTLTGEVRATGEVREDEADGPLVRSVDLRAQHLRALTAGGIGDQILATLQLRSDEPGRLLYRDLRREQDGSGDGLEGFRGNAAISWSETLAYGPQDGRGILELLGRPVAAVEPRGAEAFRVEADRLQVVTTPLDREEISVARLVFTGSAEFGARNMTFDADRIAYDPQAGLLTAEGEDRPGIVYDADGVPTGRFRRLVYNVETGQIDQLIGLDAGN